MKFLGINACNVNQIIKYKYVYQLTDAESKAFKDFINSMFNNQFRSIYNSDVNTFVLQSTEEVAKINDIDFGFLYYKKKEIADYIQRHFDAQGLDITDAFFDGKMLLCYSANKL